MSAILKALWRLEEDEASRYRRPADESISRSGVRSQGSRWFVAAAALSVGIALGAAGLVFLPRGAVDPTPRIAVAPDPELLPAPDVARNVSSTVILTEPDVPVALTLEPQPEVFSGEGLSRAALASRVEIVERLALPAKSAPSPPPIDASPAVFAAPPSATVALSKLARAPIPAVFVARTVWHPRSERRIAEVNVEGRVDLLLLREGDAVGPLVVSQIDPSGVVFLHDQIEVRRRVGVQ
ncbi:MAG: hypothetical protein V3T01_12780 [Myxococcota bacterium]